MTKTLETTRRFSGCAEFYACLCPGYSDTIIDLLCEKAGWTEAAEVADIGAGTGPSSGSFLRHGNRVSAGEPNVDMRAQMEAPHVRCPGLQILNGGDECTTQPDACADFAVSGQAFHWFDVDGCRP